MLYAIDKVTKEKRTPRSKKEKAICEGCGQEVVAIFQGTYIDHWRHLRGVDCDSWHEAETIWHKQWKEQFDLSWREVTVRKGGKYHRADIKTDKGLVLELQNSLISVSIVEKRELFYNNMIWLVNAEKFKENIFIKERLVNEYFLEQKVKEMLEVNDPFFDFRKKHIGKITKLKDKINVCSLRIDYLEEKLSDSLYKISKYQNNLDEIDVPYTDKTQDKIIGFGKGKFGKEVYEKLEELNKNVLQNKKNIERNRRLYNRINNLKTFESMKNYNLRYASFNRVKEKEFINCFVIYNDSNGLSPVIKKLNSIEEFNEYKKKKSTYTLIIDILKYIKKCVVDSEIFISRREELQKEIGKLKKNIVDEFKRLITEHIETEKKNIKEIKEELIKKKKKYERINGKIKFTKEKIIAINNNDQWKVDEKKKYKNYWYYSWNKRRSSWNFATKPVFLDFGHCIYEIIDFEWLKKITLKEFIEKVKESNSQ